MSQLTASPVSLLDLTLLKVKNSIVPNNGVYSYEPVTVSVVKEVLFGAERVQTRQLCLVILSRICSMNKNAWFMTKDPRTLDYLRKYLVSANVDANFKTYILMMFYHLCKGHPRTLNVLDLLYKERRSLLGSLAGPGTRYSLSILNLLTESDEMLQAIGSIQDAGQAYCNLLQKLFLVLRILVRSFKTAKSTSRGRKITLYLMKLLNRCCQIHCLKLQLTQSHMQFMQIVRIVNISSDCVEIHVEAVDVARKLYSRVRLPDSIAESEFFKNFLETYL